jgi:hypothetical protein
MNTISLKEQSVIQIEFKITKKYILYFWTKRELHLCFVFKNVLCYTQNN